MIFVPLHQSFAPCWPMPALLDIPAQPTHWPGPSFGKWPSCKQASTSQPCTPPSLSPLLLKGKTAPNHHPVTNTGARSAAVCVSSKLISRPNLLRRKTSGCSTSPLYFCKSHQYTVNNTCLKASLKPAWACREPLSSGQHLAPNHMGPGTHPGHTHLSDMLGSSPSAGIVYKQVKPDTRHALSANKGRPDLQSATSKKASAALGQLVLFQWIFPFTLKSKAAAEKQNVLQLSCISYKSAKDNRAERDKEGWVCSAWRRCMAKS